MLGNARPLLLGSMLSLLSCAEPSRPNAETFPSGRRPAAAGAWAVPQAIPFDPVAVVRGIQHRWTDLSVRDPRYQASLATGALRLLSRAPSGETPSQELEIRTTRVSLAGRQLFAAEDQGPEFTSAGARAERALAAGLREIVEAGTGRLEQRWLLEQLPARGELIIDVAVSGPRWLGRRGEAHLFGDPRSRLGFSYGAATARDALGRAVTVEAERVAEGLRVRIPARFMAMATAPVVVDPVIGAELNLDLALKTNISEDQTVPRVATSGTEYLVVWQDYRVVDGRNHIYGARVSAVSGALLDPTGIEISNNNNQQTAPDVAWDGTSYLVVWEENGTLPATVGTDIYGTRVSTAGAVLHPGGVKINGGAGNQTAPRVTAGGSQFLVVWHWSGTGSNGYDVAAARVSSAGVVLDPTGFPVAGGPGNQQYPAVDGNATQFLVAWQDTRNSSTAEDIYATRVLANGTVANPNGVVVSSATGTQRAVAVGTAGGNFLVAWEDARNYAITWYDVYAARVNASGSVMDPAGLAVSALGGDERYVRVASDGTDFFLIWTDGTVIAGNVAGRWVTATGTVVGSQGFQVNIASQNDLTYNASTGHFFIPRAASLLSNDVVVRRVTGTGAAVDTADVTVSMAYNAQYYPAVSYDGTNYFIVWSDSRSWAASGYDIYGVRVNAAGQILDPNGLIICDVAGNQSYPDVAFDGINYMVVWEDRRPGSSVADVFAGRITTAGARLDGQGFQLSGQIYEQRFPRIAFDGTNTYLVVWQDHRNTVSSPARGTDIYGTRVRASDGFVFEQLSGIPISSQLTNESTPSLASDGLMFAVVWSDARSGASTPDIYGARVNYSGLLLDPDGVPISTAAGSQTNPDVTYLGSGADYLAVWQDSRTAANGYDIYGTGVSLQMVPAQANGFVVYAGAGDQSRPRARMMAKSSVVLWEDRLNFNTASFDLRGARLAGTSVLEEFVLSTDPRNEIWPVLSAGGGAQGLAAYMHYDTGLKTVRVVARTYVESCTTTTDCPTGTICSGKACVTCNTEAFCGPSCLPCSPGKFCDKDTCQPCTLTAHCGPSCAICSGNTPYCDGTSCVECLVKSDCGLGISCIGGKCLVASDQGVEQRPDRGLPDQTTTVDRSLLDQPLLDQTLPDVIVTPDVTPRSERLPVGDHSAADVVRVDQAGAVDAPGPDRNGILYAPTGGCNCQLDSSSPSPIPLWLFGLVLSAWIRRRSARAPR